MSLTLQEIERQTKEFADARRILVDRVRRLNDEVDAVKRRLLPGIVSAASGARAAHIALKNQIEEARELFIKPRTHIFHDVKIGLQKLTGKVLVSKADYARVVAAIKKYFPDRRDVLIKTVESPVKKQLANLAAADLKKLGVDLIAGHDAAVISPADSDVDKIVSALLNEKSEDIDDE